MWLWRLVSRGQHGGGRFRGAQLRQEAGRRITAWHSTGASDGWLAESLWVDSAAACPFVDDPGWLRRRGFRPRGVVGRGATGETGASRSGGLRCLARESDGACRCECVWRCGLCCGLEPSVARSVSGLLLDASVREARNHVNQSSGGAPACGWCGIAAIYLLSTRRQARGHGDRTARQIPV